MNLQALQIYSHRVFPGFPRLADLTASLQNVGGVDCVNLNWKSEINVTIVFGGLGFPPPSAHFDSFAFRYLFSEDGVFINILWPRKKTQHFCALCACCSALQIRLGAI